MKIAWYTHSPYFNKGDYMKTRTLNIWIVLVFLFIAPFSYVGFMAVADMIKPVTARAIGLQQEKEYHINTIRDLQIENMKLASEVRNLAIEKEKLAAKTMVLVKATETLVQEHKQMNAALVVTSKVLTAEKQKGCIAKLKESQTYSSIQKGSVDVTGAVIEATTSLKDKVLGAMSNVKDYFFNS
jgi:hypothetical protein